MVTTIEKSFPQPEQSSIGVWSAYDSTLMGTPLAYAPTRPARHPKRQKQDLAVVAWAIRRVA